MSSSWTTGGWVQKLARLSSPDREITAPVVDRLWKEGATTFAALSSVRVFGSEPAGMITMVKLLTALARYEEKQGRISEWTRFWIRRVRSCRIIEGTDEVTLDCDFSLTGRDCEVEGVHGLEPMDSS
jgi:hypothetical protein